MLIRLRSGDIVPSDALRFAYYDGRGICIVLTEMPSPIAETRTQEWPNLSTSEAKYILDAFWEALWDGDDLFDFEAVADEAIGETGDYGSHYYSDYDVTGQCIDDGLNS